MITLIKDYWEGLCVVAVVVGAAFTAYVRWRGLKSTETLRDEYQRSFDKVVTDLSSDNRTSQLTAAILLRRFFSINEMKEEKTFLKDETINVISSLLRRLLMAWHMPLTSSLSICNEPICRTFALRVRAKG